MRQHTTLAVFAFGPLNILQQAACVIAGTLFIALAAQVSVPLVPVPMTLQTIAILIVGFSLGARLGAATVGLYLVEGAMGLPVFAGGSSGTLYMMGPTGGFLVGFIAMAAVAGWAADRGMTHHIFPTLAVALGASAVIYVPGLLWPAVMFGEAWSTLWAGWMAPFLVWDALKALAAALAVYGTFALLRVRAS